MLVFDRLADLRSWRAGAGEDVGLVPTMGALHEGHRTLLRRARGDCATVAASVFVNPTQFGPGEDFDSYPRTRDTDLEALRAEGVDAVWFGDRSEMYPPGFATEVSLPSLATGLCGRARPQHFGGVALVVLKLFHLFRPRRAYFGRKDYQQLVVVTRMARDLDLRVEIVPCPIVREADGLALSSRNRRLGESDRRAATALSRGLRAAEERFGAGEREGASLILAAATQVMAEPRIRLEYLELVHPSTLRELERVESDGAVLAIAARVGDVRLIDNVELTEEPAEGGGARA